MSRARPRGRLGRVLLGVGFLAAAYVAVRQTASDDDEGGAESADAPVWNEADAGRLDEESEPTTAETVTNVSTTDENGTTPSGGEGGGEDDLPGTDRSSEEIAERGEADVTETPAEPGEMEVDEEIVEEVVDESEADETENDGTGSDEETADEETE